MRAGDSCADDVCLSGADDEIVPDRGALHVMHIGHHWCEAFDDERREIGAPEILHEPDRCQIGRAHV